MERNTGSSYFVTKRVLDAEHPNEDEVTLSFERGAPIGLKLSGAARAPVRCNLVFISF